MKLKYTAEIRDPVHGYIKTTKVERELIDSSFLQRLRRIHQLAGAYLVYPGGVHTRFEHVLGTMHVAGLIGETIANKAGIRKEEIQKLRLAALLHDVGHGPFSHLFEEVLTEKTGMTHEDISQRIVLESEIKGILERSGISASDVSKLCVGKLESWPFMNEVIAGGLSADMMDYLLRDSYFTGVEYGKVDIHRVIDSLDVIDDHLVLDRAALYAFEALLIARYEMFKAVYFHRTVRAAELMLAHSMALADAELELTKFARIERYLKLTDEVVLDQLAALDPTGRPDLRLAKKLANNYIERKLVKCVFEKVMQRKDRMIQRIFSQRRFRDELASDIAKSSGVKPIDIYIDVPNTPSVPYTYARQSLNTITLFSNDVSGRHKELIGIGELPLVGSIAGYMDILRVYTLPEHRTKVATAVQLLFGRDDFMSRISI